MKRRKFIKTISAASAAIAAPIALIPKSIDSREFLERKGIFVLHTSSEDFMTKPEIMKLVVDVMCDGRTIVDLMDKTEYVNKDIDNYSWID
jgi:hypothetical protein